MTLSCKHYTDVCIVAGDMAVWQCRLLLGVVLTHLALGSPAVRRDLLALTHDSDPAANPLAQLRPVSISNMQHVVVGCMLLSGHKTKLRGLILYLWEYCETIFEALLGLITTFHSYKINDVFITTISLS